VKGPTEEDLNRTNHEAPQEDGVAWERHNFNLEELCRDGRKLGFLITQTRPLSFKDGEGIVFFASRGYIVGLYALPTLLRVDWNDLTDISEEASNISAPLDMCIRWKELNRVGIDKPKYYAGRKTIRKYIYIGDTEAQAIIRDAIAGHTDAPDIQAKLRLIAKAVWGPAVVL